MSRYRDSLPQLAHDVVLTDGGLETTLIYLEGVELPSFAAFTLLKDDAGTAHLRRYFDTYAGIARQYAVPAVLEAPTWRANRDWAAKLGYDDASLAELNRKSIRLLEQVRADFETAGTPIVISGNLGPRGDGYVPGARMSAQEAERYHGIQIRTFEKTAADMIAVFTMNYVEEGLGAARAAKSADMPVTISFTVETDGRLPSGDTLQEAIERVDDETGGYPVYYMINCAHPTHIEHALSPGGAWLDRIRGVRANASRKSHAELDVATELDAGSPRELGVEIRDLKTVLRKLVVYGGCCGTDHRHVDSICAALKQ